MSSPYDPSGANPFEAPRAPDPLPAGGGGGGYTGELDVQQAVREGWASCWGGFGPWLGATMLSGLAVILSFVTIIGWIAVLPVIGYGFVRFTLKAHEGNAEVGDAFSGFSEFGHAWVTMFVLFLLMFVVNLPGQIIGNLAPLFAAINEDLGLVMTGVGFVASQVWVILVVMRFYFAPFLVVDQGMAPMDAMKASWAGTADQRMNVFLLYLATIAITIVGLLALFVGIIPAIFVTYGAWVSAYRQLFAPARAAAADRF